MLLYASTISLLLAVWWLARRRLLFSIITALAGLGLSLYLLFLALAGLAYPESGIRPGPALPILFVGIHALVILLAVAYYSADARGK